MTKITLFCVLLTALFCVLALDDAGRQYRRTLEAASPKTQKGVMSGVKGATKAGILPPLERSLLTERVVQHISPIQPVSANVETVGEDEIDHLLRLCAAIIQVETGGDCDAVGEYGERGPAQFRRAAWADACKHARVDWSYDTYITDPDRCVYLMLAYWDRYHAVTDEARARLHNGGPGWRSKPATVRYWHRVKLALIGEQQEQ